MIGFSCTNCGHTFSVQDEYSGKRIKCPKCDFVGVVFDDSGRIKIICQNCGNENNVPEIIDGKEIKCPKCNETVVAASVEKEPAESADNDLQEKKPPKPKKSEITEHGLIIIICATAAVIVIGLIIIGAVTASYKARKAGKSQALQSRQQVSDTQPTEQVVQSPRKDTLREDDSIVSRLKLKWQQLWEKNWWLMVILVLVSLFFIIMFIRSLIIGDWSFWHDFWEKGD